MHVWARRVLIAGIAIVTWLLFIAWQNDAKKAVPVVAPVTSTVTAPVATTSDIPASTVATPVTTVPAVASDIPASTAVVSATPVTVSPTAPSAVAPVVQSAVFNRQGLIKVTSDLYNLYIDPKGGDVVRTELFAHKDDLVSQQPFVLLEQGVNRTYVAQSGLIGLNGADANPAGRPVYQSVAQDFTLAKGAKTLDVPLVFTDASGVIVTKTFHVEAGKYAVGVRYHIDNKATTPWQGQMFTQLKRDSSKDPSSTSQGFMQLSSFLGGAWGKPDETYNKVSLGEFGTDAVNVPASGGYIAMVQHYFVSSWVPNPKDNTQIITRAQDTNNIITATTANIAIPAGGKGEFSATLYSGPKDQGALKVLADGLDQTIDFGWLWPIAKLMSTGLTFIQSLIGNMGWSIVILTCLVKLVLWPISAKSYRSMAKMKKIAPLMARLKEEHGEDRARFGQEMMAMYKREQINPLAGCLPILLQMPIFLALYWVFMESVELRHAPWILWIHDLSAMDPFFILPIIMGVTMVVQQQLNPQPTDPMQAKMMKIMPIIFTVFLAWFPAGLVLYWIVNNLLTIIQQSMINRETMNEDNGDTEDAKVSIIKN